jgi:colicin import membrane protein
MKQLLVLCLCVLWATGLRAQAAPAAPTTREAADLQGIERTRARETAAMDAEEAACYQRFAVSGCLKDVQSARRAMLAKLRRQETGLHEAEFAARGAEQRVRNRQKAEERQAQIADLLANPAEAGSAEQRQAQKLQAQKDKQVEHAAQAQAKPMSSASGTAAMRQATGPTPAEQATNRNSYARRQEAAEKKRLELAQRLADKGGKSAAPLPLPQ